MSFLLEILGRGLVGNLLVALRSKLPDVSEVALDKLRAKVAAEPQNIDARALLGLKYLEHGELSKAQDCLRQVLEQDDECLAALLGLAGLHDAAGQTADALRMLNEARLVDILDPVILFCAGFCHERLGNDEEAVISYGAALRVLPELRNARERLAAIFLKRGDYEKTLEHYLQLVELDPNSIADRLTLANLYLKLGDAQRAAEQYEVAISLDPDNWEVSVDAVGASGHSGMLEEAIEQLKEMMSRQPEFADHHLRLGDLYARQGEDVAAVQEYEQALELEPEYLEVMVKLGTTRLRLGEFENAARWFSRAVEINDRLLSACVGLGVAQLQAGRREEGLASLQLASKIEPNSVLLFSETARMQLKALGGAQAGQLSAAAEVDSWHPQVAGATSELVDRQIRRHREAIRECPNHADLHYRLGLLLKNRNRLGEAIEALRQAVRINPNYEKALVKLGLALQQNGQVEEAVHTLQQALELRPEQAELHYQLGLLFAEKQLFELAVEHFERARCGMPTDAEVEANLSLALQNAGVLDRAQCSWRRTCELSSGDDPALN